MSIINRKAKFDYEIIRTETAGMLLMGSEVKAIRDGKASLVDAYCYFQGDKLFVKNFNITESRSAFTHNGNRDKELLLKKTELKKLKRELDKNITIIPLKVFSNERRFLKMEIALCKGKKLYDKRETIKKKDIQRDLDRNLA